MTPLNEVETQRDWSLDIPVDPNATASYSSKKFKHDSNMQKMHNSTPEPLSLRIETQKESEVQNENHN